MNKQRLASAGNLIAHYGAKLLQIPKRVGNAPGSTIDVNYQIGAVTAVKSYDIVVLARGIAAERTYVDFETSAGTKRRFDGPLFWADDGFESNDFGLGAPLQRSFLVSGSGDGALQDYIRLVTGHKSAIALLSTFRGIGESPVPGEIRRTLYEAEQEAQRCLVWNNRRQQDHAVLLNLHNIYLNAVDDWVSEKSRWKTVTKSLNLLTSGRDVKNLRLYHQCSHFTQCYPLNHLLALVLGRFILDRDSQQTIKGNTSLVSVEAPLTGPPHAQTFTHVCGVGCWKTTHEIIYEQGATCISTAAVPIRKVVDGIVIRHGLKQHTSAAMRRHLLPLHLM